MADLKNKFNRVASDSSQLQQFADNVCDTLGENGEFININQKLQADKEVISQIQVSYDEDDNQTTFVFPNNVLPIHFYIFGEHEDDWWFDYGNGIVRSSNENGNELPSSSIDFIDNKVTIVVAEEWTIDLDESCLTYIYFDNFENILDTYNLFYSRPYKHHITFEFVEQDVTSELSLDVTLTVGWFNTDDSGRLYGVISNNLVDNVSYITDEVEGEYIIGRISCENDEIHIHGINITNVEEWGRVVDGHNITSVFDTFEEI